MNTHVNYTTASSTQLERIMGEQLEEVRLSRNITQRQLAKMAGISEKTIRRFEAGEGVSLDTFIRILSALNLQENLKLLIPDASVRPLDRAKIGKERLRARPSERQKKSLKNEWHWDE